MLILIRSHCRISNTETEHNNVISIAISKQYFWRIKYTLIVISVTFMLNIIWHSRWVKRTGGQFVPLMKVGKIWSQTNGVLRLHGPKQMIDIGTYFWLPVTMIQRLTWIHWFKNYTSKSEAFEVIFLDKYLVHLGRLYTISTHKFSFV